MGYVGIFEQKAEKICQAIILNVPRTCKEWYKFIWAIFTFLVTLDNLEAESGIELKSVHHALCSNLQISHLILTSPSRFFIIVTLNKKTRCRNVRRSVQSLTHTAWQSQKLNLSMSIFMTWFLLPKKWWLYSDVDMRALLVQSSAHSKECYNCHASRQYSLSYILVSWSKTNLSLY